MNLSKDLYFPPENRVRFAEDFNLYTRIPRLILTRMILICSILLFVVFVLKCPILNAINAVNAIDFALIIWSVSQVKPRTQLMACITD